MEGYAPYAMCCTAFPATGPGRRNWLRNSDSSDIIHLGTLYSKRVLMASGTSLLRPGITSVPYRIPMPKPWLKTGLLRSKRAKERVKKKKKKY
mmetsp:Transcript_1625/g.3377  ORF Transcript_1625/g.3377 Transcript_1625/m.3377 type:complete len:93 (-) Transcript_1625:14-292(-)